MKRFSDKTVTPSLAFLLLLAGGLGEFGARLSASEAVITQRQCQPIAVLSDGDRRFAPGSLLCAQDWLQPTTTATIEVLCYSNQQVMWLEDGLVSHQCSPAKQQQTLRCTPPDPYNCPKPKGPGAERNTPILLSPYSSAILPGWPHFSWSAVAGATSYTVQVSGNGANWVKEVGSTELLYPREQPAMQPGNAYQVTIIANKNSAPISASASVLNVLPKTEVQRIIAIVKRLENLNLPPDQLTYLDLDTVYMSHHLLTETIETLQRRVQAGSQNPTLYRVLGERYLQAGLPDAAEPEYLRAATLAKQADNATELAKAQAGLRQVRHYSQLPTRTKPDQ